MGLTSVNGHTGNISIEDLGAALGVGNAGFNGILRRATTSTGAVTLAPPSLPVDFPVDGVDTVLDATSSGAVTWDDSNKVAVVSSPGMYWISTQLSVLSNVDGTDLYAAIPQIAFTGAHFETSIGRTVPSGDPRGDADLDPSVTPPFGNQAGWDQTQSGTDPVDDNATWWGIGGLMLLGAGATVGIELAPDQYDEDNYPDLITYDPSQTVTVTIIRGTFIVAKIA